MMRSIREGRGLSERRKLIHRDGMVASIRGSKKTEGGQRRRLSHGSVCFSSSLGSHPARVPPHSPTHLQSLQRSKGHGVSQGCGWVFTNWLCHERINRL